jgi:hypothetical protein
MISVGADEGADVHSEEIREQVRPRACAMGGEMLGILTSGPATNRAGRSHEIVTFEVWAHRAAPQGPVPF